MINQLIFCSIVLLVISCKVKTFEENLDPSGTYISEQRGHEYIEILNDSIYEHHYEFENFKDSYSESYELVLQKKQYVIHLNNFKNYYCCYPCTKNEKTNRCKLIAVLNTYSDGKSKISPWIEDRSFDFIKYP